MTTWHVAEPAGTGRFGRIWVRPSGPGRSQLAVAGSSGSIATASTRTLVVVVAAIVSSSSRPLGPVRRRS
eukprot:1310444-Lingulodinium_polyedra.AAC.1